MRVIGSLGAAGRPLMESSFAVGSSFTRATTAGLRHAGASPGLVVGGVAYEANGSFRPTHLRIVLRRPDRKQVQAGEGQKAGQERVKEIERCRSHQGCEEEQSAIDSPHRESAVQRQARVARAGSAAAESQKGDLLGTVQNIRLVEPEHQRFRLRMET